MAGVAAPLSLVAANSYNAQGFSWKLWWRPQNTLVTNGGTFKTCNTVNASTKPRVPTAVSLFKAKGMLSNSLNLFSAEVRRKISSGTASKECRELIGVHSSMAFLKLGLPV